MISAATLSRNPDSKWHPGLGAALPNRAPALPMLAPVRKEEGEPSLGPIVHAVGFGKDAQRLIADLCRSVGVGIRLHADIAAFADAALPDVPGCLVVNAPFPLIGGLELLARCQTGAKLPVVVAADQANVRGAVLAMKAGAVDFLEQPLREQDVLEAVGAAIWIDCERRQVDARRAELGARFETLTGRERQVMKLVTQGRLNKQVAGDLGLSEVTVKVHRGSAMRKMAARSLADLVRMADAIAA